MKRSAAFTVFVYVVAALAASLSVECGHAAKDDLGPGGIVFHHEWLGDIDQIGFNEPSGIVFHEPRGTLFVVGDEGDICEIQTDGTAVKQAHIRDADFEGVTYDPATELLYVAVEGEEKILEVHPDELRVLREFQIERTFEGRMLLKPGGQGVEAITFVPDPSHAQGGTFYLTNQSFDAAAEEDPSVVFEVEVPLREDSGGEAGARVVRCFSLGISDLAGLHYDRHSDHLYVVSDANNMLLEITRGGGIVDFWAFPGDNQEGIAVDGEGFVYIAQDSGGIVKVKWRRDGRAGL